MTVCDPSSISRISDADETSVRGAAIWKTDLD